MNLHIDIKEIILHALVEEPILYKGIGSFNPMKSKFTLENTELPEQADIILNKTISVRDPITGESLEYSVPVYVELPNPDNVFCYSVLVVIPIELQLIEDRDGRCGLMRVAYDAIPFIAEHLVLIDKSDCQSSDVPARSRLKEQSYDAFEMAGCESMVYKINHRPMKTNPKLIGTIELTFAEDSIDWKTVNSEYRQLAAGR